MSLVIDLSAFARIGLTELPTLERDTYTRQSYLGTPVVSPIEIPAGSYVDATGQRITYEGIRIDTVLVDVVQPKRIVRTEVPGLESSFKELISFGDWSITANLILSGESRQSGDAFTVESIGARFPQAELEKLVAINKVPEAIPIVCPFLQYFDIDTVVIESFRATQQQGAQDQQRVVLEMTSDLAPLIENRYFPNL